MRAFDFSIFAVLLSVAFGQVANGLQNDIVGLRANMSAFSTSSIGLMMACYYAGFSAAAVKGHVSIGRFGHVRIIAVCLLALAVVILIHPLLVMPLVWAALRFASGYAMALFDVGVESWINGKAGNAERGRIFSIYMTVQIATITLSQYILTLGSPMSAGLYIVTAVLFALGAVPVCLVRKGAAPRGVPPHPLNLRHLCQIAPLGALAVFLSGVAWATVFTLGPVFAQRIGLSVAGVGVFMAVTMGAGAVMQFPIGWISDHYGRRRVLGGLFAGGIAAAIVGWWAVSVGTSASLVAAALMGAASFPIYAVASARANDAVLPRERVAAAAGLLLLFGLGSIIGPLLCAAVMPMLGAGGYYAVLLVTMILGAALTLRQR
ncbi:MAG: MFS transporter [Rhizomicrobium sp.]